MTHNQFPFGVPLLSCLDIQQSSSYRHHTAKHALSLFYFSCVRFHSALFVSHDDYFRCMYSRGNAVRLRHVRELPYPRILFYHNLFFRSTTATLYLRFFSLLYSSVVPPLLKKSNQYSYSSESSYAAVEHLQKGAKAEHSPQASYP